MFRVSGDGYIRLMQAQLDSLVIHHLITGLDEDTCLIAAAGAASTAIAGYTEWLSSPPGITIGWDWKMDVVDGEVVLRRVSPPRSNVMLQSENEVDLGPVFTENKLAIFVDRYEWQIEAIAALNYHYQR